MYKIYLRWPAQRVSDKTSTESPGIAEAAFRELLKRKDLVGQGVAAVLSLNGRQLEYCRFDLSANRANGLKDPDAAISLFHNTEKE